MKSLNRGQLRGALIALAGTVSVAGAAPAPDPLAPVISVHEAQRNTGLAVLFARGDAVLAERYLGLAVVEYRVPVTGATRFQVMSVTKAFVGAALLKTLSLGLVDLDAPVQEYLPEYPRPAVGDITLRRLAAHTAGLAHLGHPDRRALYVRHFDTATDALETFRTLPMRFEPGTDYAYSSANYTLIAAVLEAVHGKPFGQVLDALVLEPLGLSETAPGDVQRPVPNLARSYSFIDIWTYGPADHLQQVPTWDFSYNAGGGNLVTTARDLARFGRAFIEPGFFSAAELARLREPLDPEHSSWGFGWFVNGEGDAVWLGISGATPGVQAGLAVYPACELVTVALANAWGRDSAGGDLVIGAPRRAAAALVDCAPLAAANDP